MKKLYIAALALMGTMGLQAQTFSLTATEMFINTTSNTSAYEQTTITNLTNNSVDFRYDLISESLNPSWNLQFCDPYSCFVSPRQTDDFTLDRNASSVFKLEIDPNNTPGSATYVIKVYPVANPAEADTITWTINSIVGVEEAAFGKHVTLFPNPVQDQLHLASTNGNLLKGSVSVYDLSGKLMLSSEVRPVYEMSLSVGDLAAGMYTVRYTTAQGTVNRKFLKAN